MLTLSYPSNSNLHFPHTCTFPSGILHLKRLYRVSLMIIATAHEGYDSHPITLQDIPITLTSYFP